VDRHPPLGLIFEALQFAARKHRDQRRKDPEASPYINHPIALANILLNEAGVDDPAVICAALLHDTVEDTETTEAELVERFGPRIASIVMEVTDDKALSKSRRKALQVERAPGLSHEARLVKLADKISNVRDVASTPPPDWPLQRQREYFEWARQVVEAMAGANPRLEALFREAYARKP
jgi:guanosine-3',5'-bis(diphosphate) 3'-pyrophosphohydrolase